ncbi:tryptophan--tRNA ligase [Rickettsiales endosymbiont of Peranema trichophorum]|uniref:tryptophan--tRNA ligase n=1 Tax=Rickettsiales endosymbiont of Peranema trichophorum TaxID=2486577 RepID=UPI001023753A|nr:tryptophan--tRNA ligase [Rickettsiales endosymbiont of Peranema trichophorum]RZI47620.1 tryptophan--tRNA ligase [Rickettsiales endosymbiont of Peranema trichophorum]
MPKVVLTGDRPTGGLHLGHYIGSLKNRVALQEEYQQYVMVADVQALTDNFHQSDKVTDSVLGLVADYIAVGIDPEKTTIFIQSQVTALAELTVYYMNLVTLSRLERNPTVKCEIERKKYQDSIPVGFLCYPISQAADITIFKADCVPVGEDQIPMVEQTNEIVRRFNRLYNTECLKEAQVLLSDVPRLIGIDGKAKASKSLNNAILLSDSPESIKDKVFSMFTDPQHVRVSDPGNVQGNVVFTYLDAFHSNKDEVGELKAMYQKGGLADTKVKSILNDVLQELLMPIRDRRNAMTQDYLRDIVYEGTKIACSTAKSTIEEVRDAIGIGRYFIR